MHRKLATSLVLKSIRSERHYQENLSVTQAEYMSEVGCFDGAQMGRKWGTSHPEDAKKEEDQTHSDSQDEADLLHIHPAFDGRFKDIGSA